MIDKLKLGGKLDFSARILWIICLISVLNAQTSLAQNGSQAPDWIKNLNISNYILINKDLSADRFVDLVGTSPEAVDYLRVKGEIQANGAAFGWSMNLSDGTTKSFTESYVNITEHLEGQLEMNGKKFPIEGIIKLHIFETPAIAEERLLALYNEYGPTNVPALERDDPRLKGRGEIFESLIRYDNIVAYINTSIGCSPDGVCPSIGDIEPLKRRLASLWLEKVANVGAAPIHLGKAVVKAPDRGSLVQTANWGEVPANQVIVLLRDAAGRAEADDLASSLSGQVVGFVEYINLYQIETSGRTTADLINAISSAMQDPAVELACPNQQASLSLSPLDDPVYKSGRGKGYEMLSVQKAWDLINQSGPPLSEVHVGVTDDGLYKGWGEFSCAVKIDTREPNSELHAALKQEPFPIAGSHGTGVVNLLAADPDNGGLVGIASQPLRDMLTVTMINIFAPPYGINWESSPDPSDPTKVVWKSGKTFAIGNLAAIVNETNGGSTILSCSWGTGNYTTDDSPIWAAIYKRFFQKVAREHPYLLFVCAAGNKGVAMNGSRYWPSGLSLSNMITVGNVMNDGIKVWHSNMASPNFEVTLAAPGEQAVWGMDNKGRIVNYGGGTSMATPQVTAAAALIRSLDPRLDGSQIKKILADTARTSIDVDGRKVAAPPQLGGRILAIDMALKRAMAELEKGAAPVPKVQLLDHTMSRKMIQENQPLERISTFLPEDARAYSHQKIGPVYGAHRMEWRWYMPDGRLHTSNNMTVDPRTQGQDHYEGYWVSDHIYINGALAAQHPGSWMVKLYIDGELILTEPFVISSGAEKLASLNVEVGNAVYTDGDRRLYYCPVKVQGTWVKSYRDRIYLTGPDLDKVAKVKYILDPTFEPPERVSLDPSSSFEIWIIHWGRFPMKAIITTKSGQVFEKDYYLSFKSKVEEAIAMGIPQIEQC